MVSNCTCLGCENIAKHQRSRRPNKGPCVPTKLYNRENNVNGFNVNCIPRPNVNKNYERDVKTSDLYRTKNIPKRFDRSCELHFHIMNKFVLSFFGFTLTEDFSSFRFIERIRKSMEKIWSSISYIKLWIRLATTKCPHCTTSVLTVFFYFLYGLDWLINFFFSYYPRSNDFSDLLAKSGMYRNYSLNTVMDKSRV